MKIFSSSFRPQQLWGMNSCDDSRTAHSELSRCSDGLPFFVGLPASRVQSGCGHFSGQFMDFESGPSMRQSQVAAFALSIMTMYVLAAILHDDDAERSQDVRERQPASDVAAAVPEHDMFGARVDGDAQVGAEPKAASTSRMFCNSARAKAEYTAPADEVGSERAFQVQVTAALLNFYIFTAMLASLNDLGHQHTHVDSGIRADAGPRASSASFASDEAPPSADDSDILAQAEIRKSFDLLGLKEGVSEREINTAFRKKALCVHPDKFPASRFSPEQIQRAKDEFSALNAAKDIALNQVRRA